MPITPAGDTRSHAGTSQTVAALTTPAAEWSRACPCLGDPESRVHSGEAMREAIWFPNWITKSMRSIAPNAPGTLGKDQSWYDVVDGRTGRRLGFVESYDSALGDVDASGFFLYRMRRGELGSIRHYAFPPDYDWSWLVQWSLIPLAVAWLVRVVFRRYVNFLYAARRKQMLLETLEESRLNQIEAARLKSESTRRRGDTSQEDS